MSTKLKQSFHIPKQNVKRVVITYLFFVHIFVIHSKTVDNDFNFF